MPMGDAKDEIRFSGKTYPLPPTGRISYYSESIDDTQTSNFLDISSEDLFNMDSNLTLNIEVGKGKNKLTKKLDIPKPTDEDLEWAEEFNGIDKTNNENQLSKRNNRLIGCVNHQKPDTWRLAYICKKFQETDYNKAYINPNTGYHFQDNRFSSYLTNILSFVCALAGPVELALVLGMDTINVNDRSAGYKQRNNALTSLFLNPHTEIMAEMTEMLIASGLSENIASAGINSATTQTLRTLLRNYTNECQKNTLSTDNTQIWKQLDEDSICKITYGEKEFRLRKIFNFASSTISETNEYLDNNGKVINAVKSPPTSMANEPNKKEIKQAQTMLKKLNSTNK